MEYQQITVESFRLKGISITTSNAENRFAWVWEQFLSDERFKKTAELYGVYHNYQSDENGFFTFTVGEETQDTEDMIEIPTGEYLLFRAPSRQEVLNIWQEIWKSRLPRSFSFDFEKYYADGSVEIYIAVC